MDAPESASYHKDETASRYLYPSATETISLKNGINLSDLQKGTQFEIDMDSKREVPPAPRYDPENVFKQLNFECNGDENDGDMTPFERMAHEMTDISGDGGVLKKILRTGTGPVLPEGAHVRVHYNGYFEMSEEPFDSSRLRNKQFVFRLGHGEVLAGWEIAIPTMRRGELSRFLIKPEYAYGKLGCPPRIPGNAEMLFEIEVISFVDHKAADEFGALTEEERQQTTLLELLKVAAGEREAGNDYFSRQMLGRAMNKYNRAINLLESATLADEAEERLWSEALVKLYLNFGLCCVKQHRPGKAITVCKKLLDMQKGAGHPKAFYLMGRAYHQLNEFDLSRNNLLRAARIKPSDGSIQKALRDLDRDVQKFKRAEKEQYSRMFPTMQGLAPQRAEKRFYSSDDKEMFMVKLRAFKSSALNELPFPSGLGPAEKQCIEDVAQELGLFVTSIGEGDAASVKLSK